MQKKGRRAPTKTLELSDDDQDVDIEFRKTERKKPKQGGMAKTPIIKPPSQSQLLANDDEDEEDALTAFKIRKSKLSQKLDKKKDSKKPPPKNLTTIGIVEDKSASNYYSNTVDDYSKERLEQMKNEFIVRLTNVAPDPADDDGGYVLAGDAFSTIQQTEITHIQYDPMEEEPPESVIIPTVDRIAQIKQKRDRLRQLGVSQRDFIALNSRDELPMGSSSSRSTLVREEEEDVDDEPEYDNWQRGARLQFGDPTKQVKPTAHISDDEDDEESKKWETEQLAKVGIRKGKDIPTSGPTKTTYMGPPSKQAPAEPYVPPPMLTIIKNIKDKIQLISSMHKEHEYQLARIASQVAESEQKQEAFESESASMIHEVEFFRELKDYCFDLMDCLDIKSKELAELEEKIFGLGMDTLNTIHSRAQLHASDELQEVRAILSGEPKGKDSIDKENRRKERLGNQRRKRELADQTKRTDPEGWSSDDEAAQHEMDAYYHHKDIAAESVRALLDDTHEEFATLEPVTRKFEEWKIKFPTSYKQAFGSLSFKKIAETYVKQELLARWDMIALAPIRFHDLEWFHVLFDYCNFEGTQPVKDDEDEFLVPNIIAKVPAEYIKVVMTHFYDPYSKRLTEKAIALYNELNFVAGVPSVQFKRKEILAAAKMTLERAVDSLIVLFPPAQSPLSVTDFCERQFWSAVKLFTNVMRWSDLMQLEFLGTLGIDTLLNMKLLPFLKTTADTNTIFDACVKIMAAIPNDAVLYFSPSLVSFQSFVVSFISKHLQSVSPDVQQVSTRMIPILVKLNDQTHAQQFDKQIRNLCKPA